MKLSSAEGAKLLKKLKSEFDVLKSKESISSTFLASVGENPESVRPRYDYKEVKAELDELALKIRKLKHAINQFLWLKHKRLRRSRLKIILPYFHRVSVFTQNIG